MTRSKPKITNRGVLAGVGRVEMARHLELLRSLRRIMHAFDVRSRRLRTKASITLPQLLCLMAVVAEEGLTAKEIADRLHLSASTLVGVLDRLEGKAWVRRERSSQDRRRIHIVPTQAGRDLIGAAPSPLGDRFETSFGELPKSRQIELVDSLDLMARLMASETDSAERR